MTEQLQNKNGTFMFILINDVSVCMYVCMYHTKKTLMVTVKGFDGITDHTLLLPKISL